jgi:hypothetical protein
MKREHRSEREGGIARAPRLGVERRGLHYCSQQQLEFALQSGAPILRGQRRRAYGMAQDWRRIAKIYLNFGTIDRRFLGAA